MNDHFNSVVKPMVGKIRYIKDISYGSTNNNCVTSWVEIQVFDENNNLISLNNKSIITDFKPTLDVTGQCNTKILTNNNISLNEWVSVNLLLHKKPVSLILDLNKSYNVSKIKIYHGWWTRRAYKNIIYVSDDLVNWYPIYSYLDDGLFYEYKNQPLEIIFK